MAVLLATGCVVATTCGTGGPALSGSTRCTVATALALTLPQAVTTCMGTTMGRQATPAAQPVDSEARETYKQAFASCSGTLELVGQSGTSAELEAACGWWRVCMARALPQCRGAMEAWREGAVLAAGGGSLRVEDMPVVTAIAPWAVLASCVESHAAAAGASSAVTLQHVATASGVGSRVRQRSQAEWVQAARQCDPLRHSMQQDFLSRPESNERDEMLCNMVWMYGVASRLDRCRTASQRWATHASIANPELPLQGLSEERWDVTVPEWTRLEECVHLVAGEADADVQVAWRPKYI